jgi:hypothetical protein
MKKEVYALLVGIYYATPTQGISFLGAIANARPSDIFNTGWSVNPNVNVHSVIQLALYNNN